MKCIKPVPLVVFSRAQAEDPEPLHSRQCNWYSLYIYIHTVPFKDRSFLL